MCPIQVFYSILKSDLGSHNCCNCCLLGETLHFCHFCCFFRGQKIIKFEFRDFNVLLKLTPGPIFADIVPTLL